MAAMPGNPPDYEHRVILAGGDIVFELARGGWKTDRPSLFAALERPQLVSSAYSALLDAGVEIIITHTFDANPIQGRFLGIDGSELVAINVACAQLCRTAVDQFPARDRSAWGGIGPVEPLLTLGELKEAELAAGYREQALALVEGGVQGILCSRFTEMDALRIAIETIQKATSLPIVAGMSFGSGPDFSQTPLGISVAQACAMLKTLNLTAFAVDCDRQSDALGKVIEVIKSNTDLPLWATCPAGRLQIQEQGLSYSDSPAEFSARFKSTALAGASYFEGGPGATAAHMRAIAVARKTHKPSGRRKPSQSGE
jgi:methionine synthase I (cobalamin-dependent)